MLVGLAVFLTVFAFFYIVGKKVRGGEPFTGVEIFYVLFILFMIYRMD